MQPRIANQPHIARAAPLRRGGAALLCLLWPALGLVLIASPRRSAVASVSIVSLILLGLFIAGPAAIDRRANRWWFLLQAPAGLPILTIDTANQALAKGIYRGEIRFPAAHETIEQQPDPRELHGTRPVIVDLEPGQTRPVLPIASAAHAREIGSFAAAAAGLLNCVAILFCFSPTHSAPRRRDP